jgi:hypothetical protein
MPPVEPPKSHLLRTIYVWVSFCVAGAVLAAKLNVAWHDPWCMPRWTPYFILFWRVRDTVSNVLLPLLLAGTVGVAVSPWTRRRWEVWLALCLLLLGFYHAVST